MYAISPLMLASSHPISTDGSSFVTFSSLPSILISALAMFLLYLTFVVVHRFFLSPLSCIPGPWYAAISDLWITSHVVRLQQCRTVQDLFEKYGPVVRIGPNKVAFCDLTTMRSVYCVHKFDKSDYYKSFLTCVFTSSHAIPR